MQDVGNLDRTTYIGSSDCAAILGISPYDTALGVYYAKTGLTNKELDPYKEKIFTRGKILEEPILKMLQNERNINITARNNRYKHAKHDFICAEIDAECQEHNQVINIEAKSVGTKRAGKDWGVTGDGDNIPNYYLAQIQHALMVTGRQKCLAVALVGGFDDLRIFEIERNQDLINIIEQAELNFWHNHVLAKNPPLPSALSDITNYFNHDNGLTCEVGNSTLSLVKQYQSAKEQADAFKKQADQLKELLALELKEHQGFTYGDKLILSYKSSVRNVLDTKAFKETHPTIYNQFLKQTTTRTMRLHNF